MQHFDLIVAGGGLSGVAAAVSASRRGLNVLLIEKSGSLGGAINNNLVYPFMRYWEWTDDWEVERYLSAGLFKEMFERQARYETPDSDMNFKPESIKKVLDDMVLESNVNLLLHAQVFDLCRQNGLVKSVKALTISGVMEFSADFFIDATGNGDLIALAGCDFQLGREEDELCQPMTTCFRISGVDLDLLKKDYPTLQEKYKKARADGEIKNPRENILTMTGIGKGILHLNTTRVIKHDPTNAFDVSKAELIAREQVFEIFAFLKANSKAFDDSTIISVANEIGVRESRKLKGEHILTEDEIKNCVAFEDAIALGNYEIDIHSPTGAGTELYYFKRGEFYQIPYRSLLPKEYDNLLVAGRCLSATHKAHSAVRIMPICACMGQAAGTAIALAKQDGKTTHTLDVNKLRNALIEDGATL